MRARSHCPHLVRTLPLVWACLGVATSPGLVAASLLRPPEVPLTLQIDPPIVTRHNPFAIKATFTCRCGTRYHLTTTVAGSRIALTITAVRSYKPIICIAVVLECTVEGRVGPLPAGRYTISAGIVDGHIDYIRRGHFVEEYPWAPGPYPSGHADMAIQVHEELPTVSFYPAAVGLDWRDLVCGRRSLVIPVSTFPSLGSPPGQYIGAPAISILVPRPASAAPPVDVYAGVLAEPGPVFFTGGPTSLTPVPILRGVRGPAETTVAFGMDAQAIRSSASLMPTAPHTYRLFAALVPAGASPEAVNVAGAIAYGQIDLAGFPLSDGTLQEAGMRC